MRPFDVFGLIALTVWLVALVSYGLFAFDSEATGVSLTNGEVDLREETLWMTVYQSGEEVGVMREDRTRLIDGWLIELQGVVTLEIFDNPTSFRLNTKTNVATDLSLRSAIGTVEAFGRTFQLDGRYRSTDGHDDGHRFDLRLQIDDAQETFSLPLKSRPFLIGHALPRILARDSLEVGERFTQEYFDPLTMTPSPITTVYEGKEEISQYGEVYQAHRFRNQQQGMDTTIFTDDRGSVLRQFMPLDIHMIAVPEIIGSGSYRQRRDTFQSSVNDLPPFLRDLKPQQLLSFLGRDLGATGDVDELDVEAIFPSADLFNDLDLDSPASAEHNEHNEHNDIETDPSPRPEEP